MCALATCLLILVTAGATAYAQEYILTDLGTLGGTETTAYGINNYGVVVGQSLLPSNSATHAFQYSNGNITDLGTLGGTFSSAAAINDAGQVAGVGTITDDSVSHAFLLTGGNFVDLGTLGGRASQASAINNQGQVVGWSRIEGASFEHAFLYSDGNMIDLGTLGGRYSYAYGINNSGQVVGEANISGDLARAFLYSNGTMISLGTLGGDTSYATAINNNGQVTGWSFTQSGSLARRAFLYQNGTMADIGNVGDSKWSIARDINDDGDVVGSMSDSGDNERAFLYSKGTMRDLNTLIPQDSGWILSTAYGINNRGEITGIGTYNGNVRGFLLTSTVPVDRWTFSWPSANSAWIRQANTFTQPESGTKWTFSQIPFFLRWAFISGEISSEDGVSRRAFALMIQDQSFRGLLIQRAWFPLVSFSGSKNP